MKSILSQLYEGEIAPMENFQPTLEKYQKKWQESLAHDSKFVDKLDESMRKEFEILMDEHFDLFPLEMSQVFADGFKLGVRMMCETLYDGAEKDRDAD